MLAVLCMAGALANVILSSGAGGSASAAGGPTATVAGSQATKIAQGRDLFQESCSSCHGVHANGIKGRGPSLHGVGEQAAHFYLSTGRMPLDNPGQQPQRRKPAFPPAQQAAIVAYIGSLGGPPIPKVNIADGNLSEGFNLFTDHCSGCHQVVAQGGMVTGARIPPLQHASPTQIGEAVRIGPYLMPKFSEATINQHQLNSIAKYIIYTHHPNDAGGWSIGHIGPIPEGMVTWLLAIVALILVARLIGERTTA